MRGSGLIANPFGTVPAMPQLSVWLQWNSYSTWDI